MPTTPGMKVIVFPIEIVIVTFNAGKIEDLVKAAFPNHLYLVRLKQTCSKIINTAMYT